MKPNQSHGYENHSLPTSWEDLQSRGHYITKPKNSAFWRKNQITGLQMNLLILRPFFSENLWKGFQKLSDQNPLVVTFQ